LPLTRNYPCCIRIVKPSARQIGDGAKLVLFIKGHQVRATPSQAAVLACLHDDQGRVVPYQRLARVLGYKSMRRRRQRRTLRQYVLWIRKTLTRNKALCQLAVVPRIGYLLCGHD